jgi:glycosyltransferase involved in cell wall biosynthesis
MIGDGPEKRTAQALVDDMGVRDRVSFLGQVEQIEEVLALADLVLLPSLHESFGLIALEAMACGAPVIATSRGGTSEFIDHGQNGYLCDPEDVAGMAAAGLELLRDEAHRQHVSEEARRDVAERFGARCVLKEYMALYDRLLDGAGGLSG